MHDNTRAPASGDPRISVVIVGRDGIQSLRPILSCLCEQTIADRMEVIAVLPSDRFADNALDAWSDRFRRVRTVATGVIGNRGRAAAAGVRVATAPVLAFTENHCFPDPDWAECLCCRHDESRVAGVAPIILNANPESALSWAIYGAGYAAFATPGPSREIAEMPMHNASYRRELLVPLDNELEDLLGHEGNLQRRLRAQGHRFLLDPAARSRHINEATWSLVLGLNFANGRRYGGRRGQDWAWPRRAVYAALFPLLSANIAREALRRLRACDPPPPRRAGLIPAIWLESLAHAAGEAVGYLSGPRDEFGFVDEDEFMILERIGNRRISDARIAGFVAQAAPVESKKYWS